ncbi:MAG: DEAD/DEAH box helicase, partial [Desulfobacterales bacterium]|nr:DEAD/DEAH box helicase [Desulfobacterales bacterium]
MTGSREGVFAPGARVVVRDAEWLVRSVDRTATGGQRLNVIGISELVRDKEAVFLTEIDADIQILDPADTRLVSDDSSYYRSSLLFMESLLRKTTPTGDKLYIGRDAAMDHAPYQFDAAIQALKQPRQRILIADAVGLGKTIEAGILLAELIRRGKGKRILVLAVKSMLTQFQKEMWSRFTIPLTRLDSIGIQRIRSRIPTNHNPFYYYDKSIISIDTLKQNIEYRTYIENAWWDVIVIDEAHNVARRGSDSSQRSKLARLLSKRSDTLIMLSATPHDGRAASFASLMNMLDPTAISNPDAYGPEDIRGLYIRRFKKDIQHQVDGAFKERRISSADCLASAAEEEAFALLADLEFTAIDRKKTGGMLFKTTLEKALFSSPAACLKTIDNRIGRLTKREDARFEQDIRRLEALADRVGRISKRDFSRYTALIDIIENGKTG